MKTKGWKNIDDVLPMCSGGDFIATGGTEVRVRINFFIRFTTYVVDHAVWYYEMKAIGVKKWYQNGHINTTINTYTP